MAKQGKCLDCQRIYRWPLDVPLGNAGCPSCKRLLRRVCSAWKGEARREFPMYTVTNSDIELHPMKRRPRPEEQSVADLLKPKVGPGTD